MIKNIIFISFILFISVSSLNNQNTSQFVRNFNNYEKNEGSHSIDDITQKISKFNQINEEDDPYQIWDSSTGLLSSETGPFITPESLKIEINNNNNFVLAGTIFGQYYVIEDTFNGGSDVFLKMRESYNETYTDSEGNIVPYLSYKFTWSRYYGGSGEDILTDLNHLDSNEVLITGNTNSSDLPVISLEVPTENRFGFVAKFNISGNLIWSTYINQTENAITTDKIGIIYILGTINQSINNSAIQLLIYSNNGTLLSVKQIYEGKSLRSVKIKTDNYYNLFITGYLINELINDSIIYKFDPNGSLIWSYILEGNSTDLIRDFVLDSTNSLIVVGNTNSTNFHANKTLLVHNGNLLDSFILKITSHGELLWSRFIEGNATDFTTSISLDGEENILLGGITESKDFKMYKKVVNNECQPTFQKKTSFLVVYKTNGDLRFSKDFVLIS